MTIVKDILKLIYICVGDLAQKWEEKTIWFDSHVRSMSRVKRVNDLNQDPRTEKKCSHDSNQPLLWF